MESISFCTQVTMYIYTVRRSSPRRHHRRDVDRQSLRGCIRFRSPCRWRFAIMPLSRLLHCVFTTPCPPQTTRRPVHRDSEGFPHYHLASLPLASRLRCTLPIASCRFARTANRCVKYPHL